MANDLIQVDNAATGTVEVREMNDTEQAALDTSRLETKTDADAKAVEDKARATAKAAILTKLGITEDELKIAIGNG